jgi:hypothetical protein
MVLDIVMLNAHKISSSSMVRLMFLIGTLLIQTPELVNGVHAAQRWISGKPTASHLLTLPIHVRLMASSDATMILTVVLKLEPVENAIKMVAILTLSELVLLISSVLDQTSRLIPPRNSLLSPNSSLMTVLPPELLVKSREFSFKTETSLSTQLPILMDSINNTTLSLMKVVKKLKESSEMTMTSKLRVVWPKWANQWKTVWFLLCPSGMITPLTCFG